MLEVDTTILTPHDVLKTSGHVDRQVVFTVLMDWICRSAGHFLRHAWCVIDIHSSRFADLMCRDVKTGDIYRVDHLVENALQTLLDNDEALRQGSKKKDLRELKPEERQDIQHILAQVHKIMLFVDTHVQISSILLD
jgi:glycyl-tRNA synthetase